jgi:hypothetical protein
MPANGSMLSRTTESASGCASRTTTTSCRRSQSWTGSRSSPKTTWSAAATPLKVLDQILDQYRVVQHGVSMYFGSAQALNRDHLKRLKELDEAHEDAVAL